MSLITKKELDHLCELARIEISPAEEAKLLKDLPKILEYFEELRALDTSHVSPILTGGTAKNVFREDDASANTNQGKGIDSFPVKEQSFLKIPPVFE